MNPDKLIETRGEEPPFLPGHVGESWQRVDFGLGASTLESSPEVQASLPPRRHPWGRWILFSLTGALVMCLGLALLGRLFGWPHI